MKNITLANPADAIEALGEPRMARKQGTIRIREPRDVVEQIQTKWGTQDAITGTDFVAIEADGAEYPYKKDLFQVNMEQVPGTEEYRKKTLSRLLEIPNDVKVTLITIDGGIEKPLTVFAPDFVCIGAKDEVYPLQRATFDRDFDWA